MRLDSSAISSYTTAAGQLGGEKWPSSEKSGSWAGEEGTSCLVNHSSSTSLGSHPDKHPVTTGGLSFQIKTICLGVSMSSVCEGSGAGWCA